MQNVPSSFKGCDVHYHEKWRCDRKEDQPGYQDNHFRASLGHGCIIIVLERVNKGDVTIPNASQGGKICDWRNEEKPDECHVHPGVTRDWVITKKSCVEKGDSDA